MDLLDEVIGEFDDGLTSAAESDIALGASVTTPVLKRNQRHRQNRNDYVTQDKISSRVNGENNSRQQKFGVHQNKQSPLIEEPIKANVRNVRPPVPTQKKQREQSAPAYLNGSRSKQLSNSDHRSQVLNHHIDDIFSELTNEIYVDDKRERKSATRTENVGQSNRINPKIDSSLSTNNHELSRNGKGGQSHISNAKKRQQCPAVAPSLPSSSSVVSPTIAKSGSSSGSQSTRHVNDPLPAPPRSNTGSNNSAGKVSSMAAKLSSGGKG